MFSSFKENRKALRNCRPLYVGQRIYKRSTFYIVYRYTQKSFKMFEKLSKSIEEKAIQQKLIKKATHFPKKAIKFGYIIVYKVSPIIAGEKRQ